MVVDEPGVDPDDRKDQTMFGSTKRMLAGLAALAPLALGGAAIAGAATSSSSTSTTTQSQPGGQPPPRFHGPAHGSGAHENAEKPVTGDAAAKAQTAAVKSVGSGTAGPVTTDLPGTGFETTVTKSDGTKVEVHLDRSYNVARPPGGPGGHGGQPPGPPPAGQPPAGPPPAGQGG